MHYPMVATIGALVAVDLFLILHLARPLWVRPRLAGTTAGGR